MSTIDFHSLAKTELHCHFRRFLVASDYSPPAAMANIDLPASDEEAQTPCLCTCPL